MGRILSTGTDLLFQPLDMKAVMDSNRANDVTGYGSQFMFECNTAYGKNLGVADQCLTEEQKCEQAEADFMKQFEDLTYPAIVPADHFMRLQCLKIAEKQAGLMANEILDYAKGLYAFVTAKE